MKKKSLAKPAQKDRKLTDEEMGLPGAKPTKAQLEEWLRPDENEEEIPLDVAIAEIKKMLIEGSKARERKKALEHAKVLGAKISEAQKKVKIKVTDDEIAEIVHQHRKNEDPNW